MTCDEFQQQSSRCVDGELTAREAGLLSVHLGECAPCREFFLSCMMMHSSLSTQALPNVPARLDDRVASLVYSLQSRPVIGTIHQPGFWRKRWSIPAPALAAVVLFAILSVFSAFALWHFQGQGRREEATQYVYTMPPVEVQGRLQTQNHPPLP
jgi:anti-sigma factor RsiW